MGVPLDRPNSPAAEADKRPCSEKEGNITGIHSRGMPQ